MYFYNMNSNLRVGSTDSGPHNVQFLYKERLVFCPDLHEHVAIYYL